MPDAEHLRQGLITYLLLVISITVHEWAHAFSADRLGDNTPRMQGRVTLNPLAHLDPIGTGLIPLLNIFVMGGLSLIGWGRPVQINPSNLRHRVRDDLIITLAGPFSNVLLATLGVFGVAICHRLGSNLDELFFQFLQMNVGLAVFNMIPIPPLDGSHVLRHLIGMKEETFIRLSMMGGIILLVLINLRPFRHFMGVVFELAMQPFYILLAALT
jgi:Zn-dependent protease